MNLNGYQQDTFHRTLHFLRSALGGAFSLLLFWALLIGIITCPIWLPALIEAWKL